MPSEDSQQFFEHNFLSRRNCLYHDKPRQPCATLIANAVDHHNCKLPHAAASTAVDAVVADIAAAPTESVVSHNAAVAAAEASTNGTITATG